MPNRALGAAPCFSERKHDQSVSLTTSTIRILAVDDHPQFRQGLAALLATQPDMKLVAEASNGLEAVELYRTHCPDITLMDLQMPEMNGLDAITAIREEFPEARIIVLTTYSEDAQVVRAMQVGARYQSSSRDIFCDCCHRLTHVHLSKLSV